MDRSYDKRHIFLAMGACIILFSPIFMLIVPLGVVKTLYYQREIWLTYVPVENYIAFGASLVLLVIACALIGFLDIRKWTVSVGIVCVLLSGYVFYSASLSFITLSSDGIGYRKLFSQEKQTYQWDELEKLVYNVKLPEDDELSNYEFHFIDGEILKMKENRYVTEIQPNLNGQVRASGVPLIYNEPEL